MSVYTIIKNSATVRHIVSETLCPVQVEKYNVFRKHNPNALLRPTDIVAEGILTVHGSYRVIARMVCREGHKAVEVVPCATNLCTFERVHLVVDPDLHRAITEAMHLAPNAATARQQGDL